MKTPRAGLEALDLAFDLLEKRRPGQTAAFRWLAARFAAAYAGLRGRGAVERENRHLTPRWKRTNARWEKLLLPVPDASFLRTCLEGMACEMSPRDVEEIRTRLRRSIPADRLADLLLEDAAGRPPDLILPELTSPTLLHHLNDLTHFADVTGCDPRELRTVVEWGGGYGAMAKVFRRFRRGARPATYVIIDSSLMSCVQWTYLASIFGKSEVRLLRRPGETIRKGAINLLPLGFLDTARGLEADLFLSTFALSESSEEAVKLVLERNFFGAKRLLLAYSGAYPGSERKMKPVLAAARAKVEKTPSGDRYALR